MASVKELRSIGKYDNSLDTQMVKSLRTLEHNKKMLEGRMARESLISLRNQFKINQDKYNYQAEYDRIRGLLESSLALKGQSRKGLEDRQTNFKKIGVSNQFDSMFPNNY